MTGRKTLSDREAGSAPSAKWRSATPLGLEALHRLVEHAPFARVRQFVFRALVMESDPVDPRL